MTRGVDYSWARPGGAAIKAAGFDFVLRYVDYPGASGKGLLHDEVADLQAHGLGIGLVYESTAARPLDGFGAGVADAHAALAGARKIGFPETRPIYFAVDFDAQPVQFPAVRAYFDGVRSVMPLNRIGVYGGFYVIQDIHRTNRAAWLWQALAWSGGNHYPGRHLFQSLNGQTINGGAVDFNEAYGPDQGLWRLEDEMTPEQLARLERVEKLLAGFGIAKDPAAYIASGYDVNLLTFGEEALLYAAEKQWSAFLGVGLAREAAAHPHAEGGGGGDWPDHDHDLRPGKTGRMNIP